LFAILQSKPYRLSLTYQVFVLVLVLVTSDTLFLY